MLIEFSFGLIFWMTISFLAVLFILRKFAWKPILDTLHEREQGIEDALNEAKKAREEIAAAKDKAKAEADALLARAQEEIRNEKNAAITEMKNQVAELSIQIAERILRDKLADGAAQKALVEKVMADADKHLS